MSSCAFSFLLIYTHLSLICASATGYGGIDKGGFNDAIPPAYWQYAYQFAEYLNTGDNAAELCLENIQVRRRSV